MKTNKKYKHYQFLQNLNNFIKLNQPCVNKPNKLILIQFPQNSSISHLPTNLLIISWLLLGPWKIIQRKISNAISKLLSDCILKTIWDFLKTPLTLFPRGWQFRHTPMLLFISWTYSKIEPTCKKLGKTIKNWAGFQVFKSEKLRFCWTLPHRNCYNLFKSKIHVLQLRG